MQAYLDIVNRVLKKGTWKGNRTGVRTLACPNVHFSHDMSEGFPLLTTKKMAVKSMAVELEGFIGGQTSKEWYKERGCNIWNEWANPQGLVHPVGEGYKQLDQIENPEDRKKYQKECDDLGPIYGFQWRKFNNSLDYRKADQLSIIVEKLHKNPDDRRLVCSAWNPLQLHRMALPPCHLMFVLTHIDGVLNLHWTQRSCDLMLGVPFNIASYALLLELLCKEANLTPGNLSGMLCDCHIYENHVNGAQEQVSRTPTELPTLELLNWNGIWQWTHKDIKINNYNPQPKIELEVAV
jgi:thymidylate synthase